MPKETGPFVSELALKKAAEEAAKKVPLLDTVLTVGNSPPAVDPLPISAELQQDAIPPGAPAGPGGVRTGAGSEYKNDPKVFPVSQKWYEVFRDAAEAFFISVKNYAKMVEEKTKKTANLPDKPDPIREGELSNVITVDTTNATYTPNPDTTAGTVVPTKSDESQNSSTNLPKPS